jgi:putative acetyltransferase
MHLKLRDARDNDAEQLIALIESCYAEYQGCILDVEKEVPELLGIAEHHRGLGGRFWVAESDGRVIGCVGVMPGDGGVYELRKLYVAKDARNIGIGRRLVSLAEIEAISRGARAIELWSDTRFAESHRLYERRGYLRGDKNRELHDLSKSVEYYFRKNLRAAVAIS